jgi:hypothetical protein
MTNAACIYGIYNIYIYSFCKHIKRDDEYEPVTSSSTVKPRNS